MGKQTEALANRISQLDILLDRVLVRMIEVEHRTNNLPAVESLQAIGQKYKELDKLGNNIINKIEHCTSEIVLSTGNKIRETEQAIRDQLGQHHGSMTSQFTNIRSILTLKDKDYPHPLPKPKPARGRPRKQNNGPKPEPASKE